MSRRLIWLGGWGVAPETVRAALAPAFPQSEITVLPPTRAGVETALASSAGTELGGWSLGARLLFEAMSAGRPGFEGRTAITLVCPFLAFPAEAGQGGKVSATQVKFLRRWMNKEPLAALADFYQRAGLNLPAPDALPYSMEALVEGLDILENKTPVAPMPRSAIPEPQSITLFAGENDPLIDNLRLAGLLPSLRIMPGSCHDLADFVRAIAGRS